MWRCERLARQWHARGQGFKSPQLHPRSEALSAVDRLRIARLGQQIGSNLFRHGPIRSSGAAGRGRVPSCPRPVDPGRPRPSAGRSFATKDRIGWAITDCPGGYCADRGLRRSRPTVGPKVCVHLSWCSHALTSTLSPNEYPFGGGRRAERRAAGRPAVLTHADGDRQSWSPSQRPPMTGLIDLPMPGQLMALPLGRAAVARRSAG